jgi:hypothetical protein
MRGVDGHRRFRYRHANSNPVLLMNLRYGPAWQNVQGVLPPRMIKSGVKVDF